MFLSIFFCEVMGDCLLVSNKPEESKKCCQSNKSCFSREIKFGKQEDKKMGQARMHADLTNLLFWREGDTRYTSPHKNDAKETSKQVLKNPC